MASAWERKWQYSDLGKKVVFLPSILLCELFIDPGFPMMLHGVLLLLDVSGGLGTAEPPRTRARGRSRPWGALPRRQGGHLVTVQASLMPPKERAGFS